MLRFDERDAGEPPAVFVHAIGHGGAAAWPQQQISLGRRLRFLYRRGFHPADPLPYRVTFAGEVDDLLPSLDAPAHLVAHSWSGIVALLCCLRAPERVRSAVLIEPIAVTLAREEPAVASHVQAMQPAYRHGLSLPEFHRAFAEGMGFPATPQPWSPDQRRQFELLRLHPPPWEAPLAPADLARLTTPVLVVTAGTDALFEAIAHALARHPTVEHAVVGGGGHRPQDAPAFNALLRSWWARVELR